MKNKIVAVENARGMAALLLFLSVVVSLIFVAASALSAADAADGEGQVFIPVALAEEGGSATPAPTLPATATFTATPTQTATEAATQTPSATPTQVSSPTITPTPSKTPIPSKTPTPTNTPPPGEELLVFDWNKKLYSWNNGFPKDKPPLQNGDWTAPINFAEGTLYLRAEVKSIPVNQPNMKISFCFWQAGKLPSGEDFFFETCTTNNVPGVPNTIKLWSIPIDDMWKLDGYLLDWAKPRTENGFVIKAGNGIPVSPLKDFNWGCGVNPDCTPSPESWYPMDIRFTVVVVEAGRSFSGWDTYIP